MKRFVAVILTLALLLTGCQKINTSIEQTDPPTSEPEIIPNEPEPPATEVTEAPTEPVVYEQQTMIAVSMPLTVEKTLGDDGNVVFSHSYQSMQLVVQDPDVANDIILDFLNRLDGSHETAHELLDEAQSQYSGTDNWMPYFYDVLYSPTRIDQGVLSLFGISNSYTGSRPVQVCSAVNYNMLTGEVLTLGSILYHFNSKDELINLVKKEASALNQSVQLFTDYADIIDERFDCEESFDEDWFFTDSGLCFYFSPYDIAPYSSGIIKLEIPYEELTGIIADDFFPPEEDVTEGKICGQRFNETDMAHYTQIAELILDPESERILLFAEGAVQDVRIETGSWNTSGTEFTPSCTVFASASLTPGDGIMLQAYIPDTISILRISFRSGQAQNLFYLSQSGQDGSILLSDE